MPCLLRYAIAIQMIYNMLPAGRSVIYAVPEDDDIPNQPVERDSDQESAIQRRMDGSVREVNLRRGEAI